MAASPILSAAALREILQDPDLRLFDCRFSLLDPNLGRAQYEAGHIPGARHVHLDRDLAGPAGSGGRHPLPPMEAFRRRMESWGVGDGSRIVAYDGVQGAIAGRLWWMARWLGLAQAQVLDGGLQAWLAQGGKLSQTEPAFPAGRIAPRQAPAMPVASLAEIQRIAAGDSDLRLLDARDPIRYRGEKEPIDPVAGHIPRARNLPLTGNLDERGCFLPPQHLAQRFQAPTQEAGGPAKLVHMCGSGISACHNLIAMELAGLPGSMLYPGSWSQWITDPDRPAATSED